MKIFFPFFNLKKAVFVFAVLQVFSSNGYSSSIVRVSIAGGNSTWNVIQQIQSKISSNSYQGTADPLEERFKSLVRTGAYKADLDRVSDADFQTISLVSFPELIAYAIKRQIKLTLTLNMELPAFNFENLDELSDSEKKQFFEKYRMRDGNTPLHRMQGTVANVKKLVALFENHTDLAGQPIHMPNLLMLAENNWGRPAIDNVMLSSPHQNYHLEECWDEFEKMFPEAMLKLMRKGSILVFHDKKPHCMCSLCGEVQSRYINFRLNYTWRTTANRYVYTTPLSDELWEDLRGLAKSGNLYNGILGHSGLFAAFCFHEIKQMSSYFRSGGGNDLRRAQQYDDFLAGQRIDGIDAIPLWTSFVTTVEGFDEDEDAETNEILQSAPLSVRVLTVLGRSGNFGCPKQMAETSRNIIKGTSVFGINLDSPADDFSFAVIAHNIESLVRDKLTNNLEPNIECLRDCSFKEILTYFTPQERVTDDRLLSHLYNCTYVAIGYFIQTAAELGFIKDQAVREAVFGAKIYNDGAWDITNTGPLMNHVAAYIDEAGSELLDAHLPLRKRFKAAPICQRFISVFDSAE